MLDIIGAFWGGKRLSQGGWRGIEKILHIIGTSLKCIIFGASRATDIVSVFWKIWLDIVLNTSFFGTFRACFRIKITVDYRPKKSKLCLILQAHFGADGIFSLFIIKFALDCFFGNVFQYFPPENEFSVSKSSKKLKVQKWCQNGSNSII